MAKNRREAHFRASEPPTRTGTAAPNPRASVESFENTAF